MSTASPISQLEVLGSGDLMPALVYGFESQPDVAPSLALDFAAPSWLVCAFVQAGGYAMSYYTVTGALFRLADNARHACQDPSDFLRAFHLMAEDPDVRTLEREYPGLASLYATWGKNYDHAQLGVLERWINRYFSLPSPKGGLEAFVRLEAASPKAMLGWKHLHVQEAPQMLEGASAAEAMVARDPFTRQDHALLCRVGRQAFPSAGDPRLFLVWENSD